MKNKKIFIILGIVAFILLLIALFLVFTSHKKIIVKFDTNGASNISSVEIEKGESITLPNITREGFKFLGWYIGDIKVSNDTKYTENTTIVAKWLDESIKTFTITFDTIDGSNVDPLIVECGKEVKFGPNPTKMGYEFVSWVDNNETPILDGALLACEDVTLKANWKKDEVTETKKETKTEAKTETKTESKQEKVKQAVYECPTGYKLNGTKCQIDDLVREKCPDNAKSDGDLCIILSDYTQGTRECGEKIVNMGGGSTPKIKGIKVDAGTTFCYYGEVSDDQATCLSRQRKWANSLGKCFVDMDQNYITTCPSSYQYYTSADILNKFGGHNNGGCYKKASKVKYCDDGFILTDDKCIKTIDATVTYQ